MARTMPLPLSIIAMYLVGRKEGTKEMEAVQGSCSTEKTEGLTHELV